jgi:hypothetical protein
MEKLLANHEIAHTIMGLEPKLDYVSRKPLLPDGKTWKMYGGAVPPMDITFQQPKP